MRNSIPPTPTAWGVADYRGDGRPDYFYQASLLYSDTLTPPRVSVAGGVTTLNGIGFKLGELVSIVSSGGDDGQQHHNSFRDGDPDSGGHTPRFAGWKLPQSRSSIHPLAVFPK